MRLIKHIAPGHSGKSVALRATVRSQFNLAKTETDEHKIDSLKSNAVRALSNYMLYESGSKDETMKKAMAKYHDSALQNIKQVDEDKKTKNETSEN